MKDFLMIVAVYLLAVYLMSIYMIDDCEKEGKYTMITGDVIKCEILK